VKVLSNDFRSWAEHSAANTVEELRLNERDVLIIDSVSTLLTLQGEAKVISLLRNSPCPVVAIVHDDSLSREQVVWLDTFAASCIYVDFVEKELRTLTKSKRKNAKLVRTVENFHFDEIKGELIAVRHSNAMQQIQLPGQMNSEQDIFAQLSVPFNLKLSEEEKRAKDATVLPHDLVRTAGTDGVESSTGGAVFVDLAELDDEDPDSDLPF
jgi:hypothetical protein